MTLIFLCLRQFAFNLFVEAHLKTGEISRSLINAVCEMQSGQMKVGIADVPNKVYDAYQEALDKYEEDEDDEEEEEIDEDAVMLTFLKTFKEKMKSGELKPMSDQSPNCTRCGRSDLPLTITINASTMESQKICSVCMSKGGASGNAKPQKADVDKWDKEIASLEKLAKEYEELIKKHPESDNLPSEIAQYAMTPMSNYKSIQALLADARSERMKAMISMKSEIRLNYELKKAVEAENYEESAKLRDKLNQIKK
jgi:transcription elongation factor Elf1